MNESSDVSGRNCREEGVAVRRRVSRLNQVRPTESIVELEHGKVTHFLFEASE